MARRKQNAVAAPTPAPSKKRGRKRKIVQVNEDDKEKEFDGELYEVSAVKSSKLRDNRIVYELSWVGYPSSDNSYEVENRLHCPKLLQGFAKSKLDATQYMRIFDNVDKNIHSINDATFLRTINPLAIVAMHFHTHGVIQFMSSDAIGAKRLFINQLLKNGGEWTMRTVMNCDQNDFKANFSQYMRETRMRVQSTPDYPPVRYIYRNTVGPVVQPPPPMENLVFEPFYSYERAILDGVMTRSSPNCGFDGVRSFVKEDFFTGLEATRYEHISKIEQNPNYKRCPRFHIPIVMVYSEENMGWTLCCSPGVDGNISLLPMSGKIVDTEEAAESLRNDGEAIAFTSFVKIADTGKCLDRRTHYDLSKFIKHSCNPNCSVRYVQSSRPEPDVVVYSIKNIAPYEPLTLDYFVDFHNDLDDVFDGIVDPMLEEENGKLLYLQENHIDHIICNCDSNSCRTILFANLNKKKKKKYSSSTTKKDQLKDLTSSFDFEGLKLTHDETLYSMHFDEFRRPGEPIIQRRMY